MVKLDIPKGCKTCDVEFGGRMWLVVMVPWKSKRVGPLTKNTLACIDEDMAVIMFRNFDPDLAKISLLHELLHFAFPSLTEKDLALGDSMLKSIFDGFCVDLGELLEGYE